MKALRFEESQLILADVPMPDFPDEALIRVHRAGICATDVAITRGYAKFSGTLGHEFVGTVERAPDQSWIGQRVVGSINIGCGECRFCQLGDSRHCPLRRVLGIRQCDGAFAEYLSLPIKNLRRVPASIPDAVATFTEPLASACHILEQVQFQPEMSIYLLGDGKLAQLIGRVLVAHGLHPMMIGKHSHKLQLAQKAGMSTRFLADIEQDSSVQNSADVVIEATGRPAGLSLTLKLVQPLGTVVLKSTSQSSWSLWSEEVVVPEITIVGSRCGRIEAGLALLESQRIEVTSLISAEYDLSDGVEAFRAAQNSELLKVHLCM